MLEWRSVKNIDGRVSYFEVFIAVSSVKLSESHEPTGVMVKKVRLGDWWRFGECMRPNASLSDKCEWCEYYWLTKLQL